MDKLDGGIRAALEAEANRPRSIPVNINLGRIVGVAGRVAAGWLCCCSQALR